MMRKGEVLSCLLFIVIVLLHNKAEAEKESLELLVYAQVVYLAVFLLFAWLERVRLIHEGPSFIAFCVYFYQTLTLYLEGKECGSEDWRSLQFLSLFKLFQSLSL